MTIEDRKQRKKEILDTLERESETASADRILELSKEYSELVGTGEDGDLPIKVMTKENTTTLPRGTTLERIPMKYWEDLGYINIVQHPTLNLLWFGEKDGEVTGLPQTRFIESTTA